MTWANRSQSLICHERPDRFAHSRSFFLSHLSNSLTVTHLSWAIWANRSQSLIWFEQNERMSDEWAMSKWANSQPWIKHKLWDRLRRYNPFLGQQIAIITEICTPVDTMWNRRILSTMYCTVRVHTVVVKRQNKFLYLFLSRCSWGGGGDNSESWALCIPGQLHSYVSNIYSTLSLSFSFFPTLSPPLNLSLFSFQLRSSFLKR